MLKHLLFLFLMLLALPMSMAQIPPACPSDDVPAADDCPNACIYCNLESYSGTTIGYSPGAAPGFCGTIESEQWLGLVADANNATITVVPSNCALGNGVQVALYDACLGNPIPNGCNMGASGGGGTPVSISVTLIPGTVYYLMVDAWAGDLCDFTISVSPPGAVIGAEFQTQNVLFCPGDAVVIDGITFTEPDIYVDNIPSMNGGCDTIRTYNLSYLPQPNYSQNIYLMPGESVNIGGSDYFAPDTVETIIPASVGCDTLLTSFLLLDLTVPDTCSEAQSFLKMYGEPDASERGQVLCPAADGDFYIAGEKGNKSLLMKVTANGALLWSRTFQPVQQSTTHITDLVEDSDGMLAGSAIVGDGDINLKSYAFRYNPVTDNIMWSKLIEQQSPEAFAILEKEPGGNFLLLVSPQLTLNVDDAEIWELNRNSGALIGALKDRYNLGVSDVWNSMVVHGGALYVVGRHIPINQFVPIPLDKMRMGLSKLDLTTGAPVWSRLSHLDTSVVATLFGQDLLVHDNALVSVYNGNDSDDSNATPALFLQKTSLDGDLLWVKRYDTPTPAGILASDVEQWSDGYAISGLAFVDAAWQKIILKTDFDGNVVWAKRIANTSLSSASNAFSLGQHQSAVVNDVLYLTTATANAPTDVVFLKMTSDGEISDNCSFFVEPFALQMEAISDPVNKIIQLPFNQFVGQHINAAVTTQTVPMLVTTACVTCAQPCNDTLDLGPDVVLCQDSTLTFNAGDNFTSYLWHDGSTDSTFTTDVPGIYWVEVTDACGDKQRDTVLLTVSLIGDVKLKDTTLCIGESLTISVPGFDTYDWSPSAGLSCDTCETITVQPLITTTYSLYAENADGCTKVDTFTATVLPLQTRAASIGFCPGESVTIGGEEYTQSGTVIDTIPGTVGCDTIVTYTLILLPYNTGNQTIAFCPGESVTIGGVTYTQSGTVIDTIPGIVGCDTILTYNLILLSQPTRFETVTFCQGESVTIGGNTYTQPGTVIDTIAATAGCDTIVTYTLQFIDTPNSAVSIDCPDDIDVAVNPGSGPVVVNYNLPAVSSDCECPGIALTRTQGLASGSLFPPGLTQVCYQAKDSCSNTATCCFDVFVREESACDIKTIGCLKWELLDITKDVENDLTYRIRVTNSCANKLIYTAIQMPNGLVAVAPANNSVYTAPSGRHYDVRNPNYSPFYSIRFKSQTDSIANGQSDVFKYKLPGQTMPAYIHVNARLAPQIYYEAHLNTFNCPVGVTPSNKPLDKRQDLTTFKKLSNLNVFPNPTTGALYADFSDWQGEQLKVQVFNSQGQRIQLQTVQAGDVPQQVELPEGLSAGLYFLEVLTERGERYAVRFVVQH